MSDLPTKHENYSSMTLGTSQEDIDTIFKYDEPYKEDKNYGDRGPTNDNTRGDSSYGLREQMRKDQMKRR